MIILVMGLAGTGVELVLLKHTDGYLQLAPVLLNVVALLVIAWYGVQRSGTVLRVLQVVMGFFLVSGAVGVFLHLSANVRDARESNPSVGGRELWAEAATGAIPMLAPGTMVQLALVGLAFTFRHPLISRSSDSETA
jgi:hypothetical protein